jgi:hypothetical protein
MIKLNKKQTKAFAIRSWWSWYIYWIPTIMTEYHPKEDGVLNSLCIAKHEFKAEGNCFTITLSFFIWQIDIDYWWNLSKQNL